MILQKSIVLNQCTCYAVFAIAMFDYRYPREIFNGNHSQPWWIQVATSRTTLSATALTSSTSVLAAECEFYWQGTGDFSWTRLASDVFFFFEVPLEAGKVHIVVGGFTLFICDEVLPDWILGQTPGLSVPTDSQHGCNGANRPSPYSCYSYWNAKYQKDTWVWDGENYGDSPWLGFIH